MGNITKDTRECLEALSEVVNAVEAGDFELDNPLSVSEVLVKYKVPLANAIVARLRGVEDLFRRCFAGRVSEVNANVLRCTVKSLYPDWDVRTTVALRSGKFTIRVTTPKRVIITIQLVN